jgi:hypothetical protein
MPERLSIAEELVAVVDAMPGPYATTGQRAAHERRVAAVMRHIAAETTNPDIAQMAAEHAIVSEQRAIALDARADRDSDSWDTVAVPGSEVGS